MVITRFSLCLCASALELTVKVLNINEGRNEGIARRCKTLAEYQAFVAKAREYVKRGDGLEDALKKTVLYCRDHDILREFLEHYATEVIGMLTTEWNLEDALAVRFEEGIEQGMEDVARNALAKGYSPEQICDITGLDLQTIEKIRKNMID